MTSHDREFMNRIVTKIVEIDGGTLTTYSGNHAFYEQQRVLAEKQQQAQYDRQQAMLAKEIKFIERFKARASHAAQVQSRVKQLSKIDRGEPPKRANRSCSSFSRHPRSAKRSRVRRYTKLWQPTHLRGPISSQPQERWAHGHQRRGQVTLLSGGRRGAADAGAVTIGAEERAIAHTMDLLDGEDPVFQSRPTPSRRPGTAAATLAVALILRDE